MFTGLVGDVGTVTDVRRSEEGIRISISTRATRELAPGDSVAVGGVCLTATEVLDGSFAADVMNETLARSSLGAVKPGDRVNVELSVRAADRLGGHVVQGHVDGVGTVVAARDDGFARRLEIGAPGEVLRYLVPKGSVAIDGVSLTVVDAGEEAFTVSLIPETLERTTLGSVGVGASVNLEVDILAKYVERLSR